MASRNKCLLFSEKTEEEPESGQAATSFPMHGFLTLLPRPYGLDDFLFKIILVKVALSPIISKALTVIVHSNASYTPPCQQARWVLLGRIWIC